MLDAHNAMSMLCAKVREESEFMAGFSNMFSLRQHVK